MVYQFKNYLLSCQIENSLLEILNLNTALGNGMQGHLRQVMVESADKVFAIFSEARREWQTTSVLLP